MICASGVRAPHDSQFCSPAVHAYLRSDLQVFLRGVVLPYDYPKDFTPDGRVLVGGQCKACPGDFCIEVDELQWMAVQSAQETAHLVGLR